MHEAWPRLSARHGHAQRVDDQVGVQEAPRELEVLVELHSGRRATDIGAPPTLFALDNTFIGRPT